MHALLLLAVLALGPEPAVVRDHVAVIETNHVYDSDGKHVFDQRILWRWNKWECRYEVRAWRLIKSDHNDPIGNTMLWQDSDGTLRKVTATSTRETWSQTDSELADRERLPQDRRRELTKWNRALLQEGK